MTKLDMPIKTDLFNDLELKSTNEKRRVHDALLRDLKRRGFELVYNPEEFKARLSLALEFSGKSRKQIEAEKSITSSMISTYLKTNIKPSLDTYLDLCDCLGVSPFWLMGSIPEADIEYGVKPSQQLLPSSTIIPRDQRSFQLALMLAVHTRHDFSSVHYFYQIIKGLENRSKSQVKMIAQLIESLNDDRDDIPNKYNAFLSENESSNEIGSYLPLSKLNRTSQDYFLDLISSPQSVDVNTIRENYLKTFKVLDNQRETDKPHSFTQFFFFDPFYEYKNKNKVNSESSKVE